MKQGKCGLNEHASAQGVSLQSRIANAFRFLTLQPHSEKQHDATIKTAMDVVRLQKREQELEQLLLEERERTRELTRQNDELLQIDRTKDEFVTTVSHEFRTPLTSICGYLEALVDGEAGELNDAQKHFLKIMECNTDRLSRLVEDLLFAAHIDAGGTSVAVFAEIDVTDVIAEVMQSARPIASAKNIDLRYEIEDRVFVAADPIRITQLLENLTSNALKFTPEGGEVLLKAYRSGKNAIISVADTGMGIPQSEQSKLFQRFFRSAMAQQQAIGGTGIGLAVVKDIADAHGAELVVESTVGKGTIFQVILPIIAR